MALVACLPGCMSARSRTEAVGAEQRAHRQALSRSAQAAADRQDWPQARAMVDHLVAAAPASAEARQQRGRVLLAQGDPRAAMAEFQDALALDDAYAAALVGLGLAETRLGMLQQAVEHLEQAIELDPKRGEAHLARAQALEAFGRGREALASYYRALEFEPGNADAMIRVAALQVDGGHPEQALARLEQALEVAPNRPEAWHQRGRARLAIGDSKGAIDDLKTASRGRPNDSQVFFDLALALERAHEREPAQKAAEEAIRLAPQHAAASALLERLRR